jgi:hypothetical protein
VANWTFTGVPAATGLDLGHTYGAVALAVDGQGHPRIFTTSGPNYFECNGNCTSSTSWQSATLSLPATTTGNHVFAVTPDGTGAAVVISGADATSLTYESCASGCTTSANWHAVKPTLPATITESNFSAALAMDSQGRPQLLYSFNTFPQGRSAFTLGFATCPQGDCSSASGWQNIVFQTMQGQVPGVEDLKLAVDGQGRLRAWAQLGGPSYRWCDADCSASPKSEQNWHSVTAPDATDMGIDANGTPYFVNYSSSGSTPGVVYSWCSSGCDSAPTWEQVILPDSDLDAVAPDPGGASGARWQGNSTRLSVGAAGNAAIILNAARYPTAIVGQSPDAYGVFLRIEPPEPTNPGTGAGGTTDAGGDGTAGTTGTTGADSGA